jgi:hypothetical protein
MLVNPRRASPAINHGSHADNIHFLRVIDSERESLGKCPVKGPVRSRMNSSGVSQRFDVRIKVIKKIPAEARS